MPTDTLHVLVMKQRRQLAEAIMQGYLDAGLAADLSTVKSNGFKPGRIDFTPSVHCTFLVSDIIGDINT